MFTNCKSSKQILYKFFNNERYFSHVPVMAKEIVNILRPKDGKVYIDMTFGAGGHTKCLLDTNHSITVVAVDRDPVAFKMAQQLSAQIAKKSEKLGIKQTVIPIHGKFSKVMRDIHLSGIPYGSVDGVIFDLGASSIQYDNSDRGFSLSSNGPLDMRMDTTIVSDITAEDVVNNLSEQNLGLIFKFLGEEKKSRKMASAIADARLLLGRIKTTQELAKICNSTSTSTNVDSLGRYSHPATKVFQAIRIFVNNELNELNYALSKIREFLIPASSTSLCNNERNDGVDNIEEINCRSINCGIAAVLTFHSLEDRIVKRHFTGIDVNEPVIKSISQHDRIRTNVAKNIKEVISKHKDGKWKQILKHVKKPSDEEIASNPRSRSAKLRVAMRLL